MNIPSVGKEASSTAGTASEWLLHKLWTMKIMRKLIKSAWLLAFPYDPTSTFSELEKLVSLNRLGLLILISFLASCEVQLCSIVVVMVSASLFTTLVFYFSKVYANSCTIGLWDLYPECSFMYSCRSTWEYINCKKGTNHIHFGNPGCMGWLVP